MLAALPSNIVISEAPPIDDVLQGCEQDKIERLRWIVAALGQKRTGVETH